MRALAVLALAFAGSGCGDACVDMFAPTPITEQAARYQIDLYGPGVACSGAHAAAGAPAPQLVRTFAATQRLSFSVPSGDHTVVLTAFSAARQAIGSACYRGHFGLDAHVCLSLQLVAPPDLGICSSGGCPCTADDDCGPDQYCAPGHVCQPGCRGNGDCLSASDGGQTVLLPLCDVVRHVCVGCRTAADCVRAPACQGDVLVSYPAGGSPCVGGACMYPTPAAEVCQFGCYASACSGQLAALTNVRALQSGTQTPVDIAVVLGTAAGGGSAPATRAVTVLADAGPPGAAKTVTLVYMLNGNFANQMHVTMQKSDTLDGSNELWSGDVPPEAAGTRVYFFVSAVGWDGTTLFAPGSQRNYAYSSN
jgi:hypothetical protein